MSMITWFYVCLSEHSSHSFQAIFNGKYVILDVLDTSFRFRCGYLLSYSEIITVIRFLDYACL